MNCENIIINQYEIKSNPKKLNNNNINDKALDKLLLYFKYNNLGEIIEEKIIAKKL